MIQDISPFKYHVEYKNVKPKEEDFLLIFTERRLMLKNQEEIGFFQVKDLSVDYRDAMVYLFSVDDMKFFYLSSQKSDFAHLLDSCRQVTRAQLRSLKPKHMAFAAVTAFQLDGWYSSNKYCGCCQNELVHDSKERMLRCASCGNMVYPRINPAVIVAVTNEDKILLTKYRGREYKNYALVAGFVEIGESFEDTVRREVMEEAGLVVNNIRYYGSQPWAFADNILAGYFCEVEGSDEIKMDSEELSVATWVSRQELDIEYTDSSLTNEMIVAFKNNKY